MHTTIAPALTATFSVIAERFRRAGQHDRAVALCREGLAQFPEHLSARVTLGCALLDLGQEVEALKELQAVIKRAPDNLAAIRGLAELHARGVEEHEGQDWPEETSLDLEAPQMIEEVTEDARERVPESIGTPLALAGASMMVEEAPEAVDLPPVADEFAESLDDLDPVLEPAVMAAPLQFEIEDVIDEAMEPDTLDDFDPELPPAPEAEPERPELSAHHAPPAIAVPELSSGPIAVLDEWLTRIRARRAELLSEYAAS